MSRFRHEHRWRGARVCLLLVSAALALPLGAASPKADEERFDKDPEGRLSSRFYPLALDAEHGRRPGRWALRQAGRDLDPATQRVLAVVEIGDEGARERVAGMLRAAGGTVSGAAERLMRVELPADALRRVSRDPDVRFVRPPMRPHAADVVSEGVAAIGAAAFLDRTGFDGTGVKVGVLDLGYGGLEKVLGHELPADTILTPSMDAKTDRERAWHGTACAEIVHDVAPGATLVLANVSDEVRWWEALDQLLAQGVKIVSASIGFPNSYPTNGGSYYSRRVASALAQGVLWVNAAGNETESFHQGTASDADANGRLEFRGLELVPIRVPKGEGRVVLRWDEPFGLSREDYDLYVVTEDFRQNPELSKDNPAVVAASTDVQSGSGNPIEWATFESNDYRDLYVVVANRGTAPVPSRRNFSIWVDGWVLGGLATPTNSIVIPADAPAALAVAAVDAGTRDLRGFSSRGPTDAGLVKPDLAGPDGVSTWSHTPFFGTSAAAPHVAGAAALLWSRTPSLTAAQVREQLEKATASGGLVASKNNDVGYGAIDLARVP